MVQKNNGKGQGLIGIISYNLHSNLLNYGAALHSYAFQQYLSRLGSDSVIIDYNPVHVEKKNLKYPFLNLRKIGGGFNHHFMNFALGAPAHARKHKKFQEFFKKHCRTTQSRYTIKSISAAKDIDKLDIRTFVTESDVTWKSYWDGDFDLGFYLKFPAAEGKRKVAYAPSMHSRPFCAEDEATFRNLVKDFSAISSRERQGAEYISSILEKPIDWYLDPTLLLDADDYRKIAIQPHEKGYVLLYNCMKNDRVMVKEAEKFAATKGLKLIEVSNFYENSLKFDHIVKTDIGIEEWLGLFDNAEYVICNAFHGFCFSVIFRKQVILFERDGSDFRMRNITEALDASDCMIPFDDKKIPDSIYNAESIVDYDTIIPKLSALREKSRQFITQHITAYESH